MLLTPRHNSRENNIKVRSLFVYIKFFQMLLAENKIVFKTDLIVGKSSINITLLIVAGYR